MDQNLTFQDDDSDDFEPEPLTSAKTGSLSWSEPIFKSSKKVFDGSIGARSKTSAPESDRMASLNAPIKAPHSAGLNPKTPKTDFEHICRECGKTFKKKDTLTRHLRTHTGDRPFKCDVCPKDFSDRSTLIKHNRTHTGERPFKCDICTRGFKRKETLTAHLRTHTGEKPFKCDVCTKDFSQKEHLTAHLRTHTGERPFKCNICPKDFSDKGNLTAHLRTHTGERPFQCTVCKTAFTQSNRLKAHLRKHVWTSKKQSLLLMTFPATDKATQRRLPPGTHRCGVRNCAACVHIREGNKFTSRVTRETFEIAQPSMCSSRGIIYLITCKACSYQYVGRTSQRLRERLQGHIGAIEGLSATLLATHFRQPQCSHKWNLEIQAIEKCTDGKELACREAFWMDKLKSKKPNGLNAVSASCQ